MFGFNFSDIKSLNLSLNVDKNPKSYKTVSARQTNFFSYYSNRAILNM